MARWHTREDSGIRLDRQLRWWHDDEPIEHPKIVELFNKGLVPTDDGKFKLTVGNDWCFVTVEDAAYSVLVLDEADGQLWLRLSDRTAEPLDPSSLKVDSDGVVTAAVKAGKAKARFSRDAQFALGERLSPGAGGVRLQIGSAAVDVPSLATLV
jgi:hypothetical protein